MEEKQFIDIKKRSYFFSLTVIQLIDSLNVKSIFFSLISQLFRSSTSIGANLVEAKSAHSKKDFIKFYEVSLKSSNETKYWLCLLRDGLKIDKDKINKLLAEVDEISKIIATIIIKLKKTNTNAVKEENIKYGSDDPYDFILTLNENFKFIEED
ncbi:MAG: four helix bundle protein [Ignavibacteriaceae bacterium]